MKKIVRNTLFGLLFLAQVFWQSPVFAGEGPNFTLKVVPGETPQTVAKGYYVFDATPNTVLDGEILVINNGSQAGKTRLYAVDATTGQTGGTIFRMYEDEVSAAGSWIQLSQTELTLDGGESRAVPFTVTVPAGARAGHHVGGIVTEAVGPNNSEKITNEQDEATFNVAIKTRTVIAVQVNVAGPLEEKIEINGVYPGGSGGRQTLFLGLQNDGNAMVKPEGSMIVSDEQGRQLQALDFQIDTFLPETKILFPIFVENEALPAGTYVADVNLTYGASAGEENKQVTFRISEAQNSQIFSAQEALAAPAQFAVSNEDNPAWRPYVIGGLGFVNVGLIGLLMVLVVQYVRQRRRVKRHALSKAVTGYKMGQSPKVH